MSITRSTCRCISSSAATRTSTCPASRSAIFFAGKLAVLPGERPTISDWANHLSTIFPEVRLKRYLEMRGADGGPWRRLPSLPAFWVGLLYDDDALDAGWEMVKDWSAAERQKLRDDVPRLGFRAEIGNRNVLTLAQETLRLCAKRPAAPQEARPQRPRRDALSATARRIDRARHHAGGGIAGEVFQRAGTTRSSRSSTSMRISAGASMAKGTPATACAGKGRRRLHAARIRLRSGRDAHRDAGGGSAWASSRRACSRR